MENKYLLSICMIIRDEAERIGNCLDSLKCLLESPEVELIIVDTGSIDNTIEIAKQYTDKVYFHDWEDSFAKARNYSIQYATGEWIYIIDADEQIENPEVILPLLQSQQVSLFNSILVTYKNYMDLNTFSVHEALRLFRNDGSLKYTGVIHEQPTFKEPFYIGNITVRHFINNHYITGSDKPYTEYKKTVRNYELVKKELQDNPDNIYLRIKLANHFLMVGENEMALQEIKTAYLLDEKHIFLEIYFQYTLILNSLGLCDEAIKIALEGIEKFSDYIDLYFFLAELYKYTNQKEKAFEYFDRYFGLYEKYSKGEIHPQIPMVALGEQFYNTAMQSFRDIFRLPDNIAEIYQNMKISI